MTMKLNPIRRLLGILVPACLTLVACGGGGGDGAADASYVTAKSASFSPTTAKASSGENVALRWVYVVNDGQPVTANLQGVSIGVTVSSVTVTLDPVNLQRVAKFEGPVSASVGGVAYSGAYTAVVGENLQLGAGKTLFENQTVEASLTLSGGGESAAAKLTTSVAAFTPPYEWFIDRETLDQLPIGHVQTVASTGTANVRLVITDVPDVVMSNQPTSVSDRWTVLAKLPGMEVRGKTYSNVVQLSRQTKVPDFSGGFTAVTMYYWVAKGVGMIRGEGIYSVLNLDNVVYELTETNLSQ